MDDLTGRKDTKTKEGAIGIFTKGTVKRKDLYKHGIFMALVPFLTPGMFQDDQ
jgi:non-canonical (house-cleaning) NTP pyrophosphatase